MKFLVLGPTEARQADQPIALSGARRRALVTRLVLDAGRSVSAETLLEDVWDGHAPPAASATLQSHVSQLRKVIGNRLQRSTTGYLLSLDAASVDADQFEDQVANAASHLAQGDVGTAALELRGALRLWRGRALQDVADRPWAMPQAERLEELRRAALEQLLRARLASGEHEQVVPEAEAAVEEYPLREQRWATLMLALYRSGRQAEALRAYQRLRARLVDELGIDPSPPLAALEVALLRQDPVLQSGQQSGSGRGIHHTQVPRTGKGIASGVVVAPTDAVRHSDLRLVSSSRGEVHWPLSPAPGLTAQRPFQR